MIDDVTAKLPVPAKAHHDALARIRGIAVLAGV